MFKIFIIVFLASGGHPIGTAAGKTAYPTLEECQAILAGPAEDTHTVAAYQVFAEQAYGSKLRLAATCAEVGEDGTPLHEEELPSKTEQNPL